MRWKDIGGGSLHVRHIGFDLSYDFVLASSSLPVDRVIAIG